MKRLSFLFFAFAFLFSGCGQSGPLYIPGNPSTMAVPPTNPAASEEDAEDDENNTESPEAD